MERISSQDIVDFYSNLDALGIKIWIDGGWSVDALLEKETREHNDVDIAIEEKDVAALVSFLKEKGYKEIRKERKYNLVFGNSTGKEIDVHIFIEDKKGNIIGGIKYPVESLSGTGILNGQVVRCISAEYMVKFLAPWLNKHPHKYLEAIEALCKKFGIEYPKEYTEFIK